eukprot:362619-Chlamydomonas_euryale.AAC.3
MSLPPVHSSACSNVHSDLDVGLDSGMMMGYSLYSAMSLQMFWSKAPATVDTPMSTVGRTASTVDRRSFWNGTSCANGTLWCWSSDSRDLHTRPFESTKKQWRSASSIGMPARLHRYDAISCAMPVPASPAPRNTMRWPNSTPSCPEPRSPASTAASVIAAVPWMSSLKQHCFPRYVSILKLHDAMAKHVVHRRHELAHECVVSVARQALIPYALVPGRVEQLLADGQAASRVDTGSGGVERDLAFGDPHAVGAQVAEPEDALAIGDNDDTNALLRQRPQRLCDVPTVLVTTQVHAVELHRQLVVLLAGLAHSGGVDERQNLLLVPHQQAVKLAWRAFMHIPHKQVLLDGRFTVQLTQAVHCGKSCSLAVVYTWQGDQNKVRIKPATCNLEYLTLGGVWAQLHTMAAFPAAPCSKPVCLI